MKEKEVEEGSTAFVDRTIESYSDLVAEVRKQFQMLKPERLRKIAHLERGEEIDLNAAIEASVDRRAGRSPSEKVYIEKLRKDRDYGNDRTDKEYAFQDTIAALEEASKNNIFTFCITVDRAGHDYLRRMMPASRYLVIDETVTLPRQLPKIYRKLTS